jgi:hypothetical protein
MSELTQGNSNATTEDARMNRCADFLLRGVLGMVAGVRHAARHQRLTTYAFDLRLRPTPSTYAFDLCLRPAPLPWALDV